MLRLPLGHGGRLLSVAALLVCAMVAAGCGTSTRKTACGGSSLGTGTVKVAG